MIGLIFTCIELVALSMELKDLIDGIKLFSIFDFTFLRSLTKKMDIIFFYKIGTAIFTIMIKFYLEKVKMTYNINWRDY